VYKSRHRGEHLFRNGVDPMPYHKIAKIEAQREQEDNLASDILPNQQADDDQGSNG